jgi:L-ribulose-5-phosphate 4-epimerase
MVTNFVPMKLEVMRANLDLPKSGLVKLTWGNVSMIDRERELIVIKPSGVPYADMSTDDMVVTDLEGKVLEGELSPSSDLATHLVLYKAFKEIGAVVHTHSKWAVAWAQGGKLPYMPRIELLFGYGGGSEANSNTRNGSEF